MPSPTQALTQHPLSRRAGLLGGAAGLIAGGAAVVLALAHAPWWLRLGQGGGPEPVASGLHHLAGSAAALVLAWIAVLLLLGAAAVSPARCVRPARRLGLRLAPRLVPRVAAALLALAVAGPTAAQADQGAPTPLPDWSVAAGPTPSLSVATDDAAPAPESGWQPAPPRGRADVRLLVGGGTRQQAQVVESVVVRPGDTLWSIAARHLGPDASTEDIAAEWPRWHAANRDTLGPDPDLILPGQELVPPGHAPLGAES